MQPPMCTSTTFGKGDSMNYQQRKTRERAYKRMRELTTGMAVWTWDSWESDQLHADGHATYWCKCKDRWGHDLGRDVFSIASKINRTWVIKIRVKCRTEDGQEYTEETELEADNMKLDDFKEVYQRERESTLSACNPKHVLDVGWKAIAKN